MTNETIAIEPNQGISKKFQRKIAKTIQNFQYEIFEEIVSHLENKSLLAEDSISLRNIKKSRYRLVEWARRNPEVAEKEVDEFVTKSIGRWNDKLDEKLNPMLKKVAFDVTKNTSDRQEKSITSKGVSQDFVRAFWTNKVTRTVNCSIKAVQALPPVLSSSLSTIKGYTLNGCKQIGSVVSRVIGGGFSLKDAFTIVKSIIGDNLRKIKNEAESVVNLIHGVVQTQNSLALGFYDAVWVHVPGKYSSRESHKCWHTKTTQNGTQGLNGARFDLRKGIYDGDVGMYIVPKQLKWCVCCYRNILPKELLSG